MNNNPTALYRHFDAEGKLLYIGVSINPFNRLKQHELRAKWIRSAASMKTEWFDNRCLALDAEKHAIKTEKPLFNIIHNLDETDLIESPNCYHNHRTRYEPFFYNAHVPTLFVRSAIFTATQGKKRRELIKEEIFNDMDVDVIFSGVELNQIDLDVWIAVHNMILLNGCDGILEITPYMLLKVIDKEDGGKERNLLKTSLSRMSSCILEIASNEKIIFSGPLIAEIHGNYELHINKELIESLSYAEFAFLTKEILN